MSSLLTIPRIELYKKLFELRNFDFVTIKDGKKHEKQELALKCLIGNEYKEVGYGGAAGGAKSWTGCVWLAFMCLLYPGTRWFIGREELKRLRESTLITFFKVCKAYHIEGWKYNGQDHFIQFENGSRIDLLEMKLLPSDPLFERYGSIEYTGGWVEEAGEVSQMGYDTLKSRIGRQYNDKYNIKPTIYVTFNPKKNFVYSYFYRRDKEGTLPKHIIFIKALLYDNPHREMEYEGQLLGMSNKSQVERLLNGNFEYDDDPTVLCDYDAIMDCFTNTHVPHGTKAISADLAMKGRDKFIVGLWDGNRCKVVIDKPLADGKIIETDVKNTMISGGVGHSQTVVDSDGMGSYLESYLKGIKEFHGGAAANDKTEYANLKSECGYKLAELINKRELYIECNEQQKQSIAEELGQLKQDDVDADEKKKRIIKKDQMKENLGRSPDYLDMLLMKMVFNVKRKPLTSRAVDY